MTQNFTLHTHTTLGDGRNTAAEMVARATEMGMKTIGFSDHFIVHPEIRNTNFYPYALRGGYAQIYSSSFDEIMARFVPAFREFQRIASESKIRVLRGLEVDFFDTPSWRRGFESAIQILQPDYLIGACHFVDLDGRLYNVHDMANADSDLRDIMLKKYWQKICAASKSGLFSWMAHLDLPRKVNVGTDEKWRDTEQNVIDALAHNNTGVEINTSLQPDPHPSRRILEMVSAANIPVLVSDDAHSTDKIGRRFDVAERLCAEFGIKNRLSLQKILDFSK